MKELDNHIYKFYTGDLKDDYILLSTIPDHQTLYINFDHDIVTPCQYVNDQLTLIGD